MTSDCQVLIAGPGPTGLVLARGLRPWLPRTGAGFRLLLARFLYPALSTW